MSRTLGLTAIILSSVVSCSDPAADDGAPDSTEDDTSGETGDSVATCAVAAPDALRVCVSAYSDAIASCYASTDAPCAADDPGPTAALTALEDSIGASCEDGEVFPGLSRDALVGRLQNACASEASSIAWRTYGGPQGAVWPAVDADDQACLAAAHLAATELVDGSLAAIDACLADDCEPAMVADERESLASAARADIAAACGYLPGIIAIDPGVYVERAVLQVDCLAAVAHTATDTEGLELACGPGHVQFEAPRGEWTQVVVDGEEWGTLCGDGSPYAFQIRLAPAGEPLDRVLIGLQGGGVCLFEDDCSARLDSSPGLFTALDDVAIGEGIGSDEPADSPFASWTKVYLPYCNQDVFAGGGVVETLGSLEMPRYGAVNLRAAVRMVRDYLWRELDAAGDPGFRPDELVALFGGWSAGAYGTLYNYHWLLDELQWPRTIAFPDAGLALDNGSPFGVSGLGTLKLPAWGTLANLPSYCFDGSCAVGPTLYQAISPRLKQVPEQQMLILTNPKDATQQGDAFFDDEAVWINEIRQSYCETKDLPGINYYITSVSDESIHVVSIRDELWTGSVDGELMRDWFARAVEQPDTLESRVEEADFVDLIPGVEPFPCPVAP